MTNAPAWNINIPRAFFVWRWGCMINSRYCFWVEGPWKKSTIATGWWRHWRLGRKRTDQVGGRMGFWRGICTHSLLFHQRSYSSNSLISAPETPESKLWNSVSMSSTAQVPAKKQQGQSLPPLLHTRITRLTMSNSHRPSSHLFQLQEHSSANSSENWRYWTRSRGAQVGTTVPYQYLQNAPQDQPNGMTSIVKLIAITSLSSISPHILTYLEQACVGNPRTPLRR